MFSQWCLEFSQRMKCIFNVDNFSRLQLQCDGKLRRPGGEVKGKLANAVGNQYSSHYLGTRCIQHYYRWCRTPLLPAVDWTDAQPTGRFKWPRLFRRKTKSGFCAFAFTFLTRSTIYIHWVLFRIATVMIIILGVFFKLRCIIWRILYCDREL